MKSENSGLKGMRSVGLMCWLIISVGGHRSLCNAHKGHLHMLRPHRHCNSTSLVRGLISMDVFTVGRNISN